MKNTSDDNNTPNSVDNPRVQVGFTYRDFSMVTEGETGYTGLKDNDTDRNSPIYSAPGAGEGSAGHVTCKACWDTYPL